MSLLNLIFFGGEPHFIKRYLATSINGDLLPTADDQLQLFATDSIVVKNNTAYWYYTGNGQGDGTSDPDIVFMASKDLTTGEIYEGWNKYLDGGSKAVSVIPLGASGQWDDRQTLARTVIYDEDEDIFKHWYLGQKDSSGQIKIGYATSLDGFTWTKHGGNPIYTSPSPFANLVVFFAVYKESPTLYHAIASGNRNVDLVGAIYLTSTDGISWVEQENPIMVGLEARDVLTLRKSGSTFYLYCEQGFNADYHDNIRGVPTDIYIYSTTDFVTFTDIGSLYTHDEPNESGLMGANLFEYVGKFYCGYSYFKNQVKATNISLAEEPYMALRIMESNRRFHNITDVENNYPSYLKRYYPCYQKDESQTPTERITNEASITTGTLSWVNLKYVDFTGSQLITYPEYVPGDTIKFAVKGRVLPQATSTRQIIRQSDGTNGWAMFLNSGKLQVDLYEDTTLKKSYITVDDVVKPAGVWDEYDHTSVGFIFDSGSLKLCFGASADQATTKTIDLALSDVETGSNDVEIGAGSVTNEMGRFCIFDEITEDQWLNVIDL